MHSCPSCRRHIREAECPFCHAAAPAPERAAGTPVSRVGLKRSALVASVLAAAACSPPVAAYGIPVDATPGDTGVDSAMMAAYGIPIDVPQVDATADDATADVTPQDTAPDSPVAAYGLPPDSGSADSGFSPPYGIPVDAGTE